MTQIRFLTLIASVTTLMLIALPVRAQAADEICEWISVSAFGAKGNGTNDDTAAIQNALDAAAKSGGGAIVVPRGTFVLTAPVAIGANCTLEGIGGASVLKWGGGVWTNTEHGIRIGVMVNITGTANVHIVNLVFDAGGADLHVIRMENGINTTPLVIENNRFQNLSRASASNRFSRSLAISLSGGRTFTRNNYCDGASSDTFNYNNGWHLVADNIILNGEDGGIAFNNGAHGVISGNWLFNCDLGIGMGHPGSVEQSQENSTTITGNAIEQCMLGINMGWFGYKGKGAPRNWTISGNVFKNSACGDINYDGPERGFAANGAVSGNTSYRVGSSHHKNFRHTERGNTTNARFARLVNCDNVTVSGNTVVDPQAPGALLTIGGSKNIIVANNLFRATKPVRQLSAILLNNTTGLMVSGNRVAGECDYFLTSESSSPVTGLHINDNVVENCRSNAISIHGQLGKSEILDNRFSLAKATAIVIICPDIATNVVIKNNHD